MKVTVTSGGAGRLKFPVYSGQFLWIMSNLDLVIVVMNHMTSVQKGGTTISPKEIEELILPVLVDATRNELYATFSLQGRGLNSHRCSR
ncbi:MAG: hypothetical protein C0490_17520 [Marivirga sp.]|nr:hypothetical protein [Marivirga sp.]